MTFGVQVGAGKPHTLITSLGCVYKDKIDPMISCAVTNFAIKMNYIIE